MGKTAADRISTDIQASKYHNVRHILPSAIRVDFLENHSRECFWSVGDVLPEIEGWNGLKKSSRICLTRPEIEARLESFLATKPRGQIDSVDVYATNTGVPVLAKGYLRWSAMALAESRGLLGQIAGATKGLRCNVLPPPKNDQERHELELANFRENHHRLNMTAIDFAHFLSRQETRKAMTRNRLSQETGLSVRVINDYLRLLSLPLSKQIAVREGWSKTAALGWLSKNGEGTATGPQKGRPKYVKHSQVVRALEAQANEGYAEELLESDRTYTGEDVLALIAWFGGRQAKKEAPSEFVKFIEKAPKKAPKGKKKAKRKAPTNGESRD